MAVDWFTHVYISKLMTVTCSPLQIQASDRRSPKQLKVEGHPFVYPAYSKVRTLGTRDGTSPMELAALGPIGKL